MTDKTDRELLELAAKGAGIEVYVAKGGGSWRNDGSKIWPHWNPLEDDGDALRLAVRLRMLVDVGLNEKSSVEAQAHGSNFLCVERGVDSESVRRAIVRSAAEVGKAMP